MQESSLQAIQKVLLPSGIQLVAVSKTKSVEEILSLYNMGQRDFGENYVQELVEKEKVLPKDIRWHFIGHLQSNKVKFIAPFVYMIQSADSLKLLMEIEKHAGKNQRSILCLFQIYVALEETKFGLNESELELLIQNVKQNKAEGNLSHIKIGGCMGMASFTENKIQIKKEFVMLGMLFNKIKDAFPSEPVNTLSMGMSNDYLLAVETGSTMVRIGSLLFGKRQ